MGYPGNGVAVMVGEVMAARRGVAGLDAGSGDQFFESAADFLDVGP
jgi:hypothetical protein